MSTERQTRGEVKRSATAKAGPPSVVKTRTRPTGPGPKCNSLGLLHSVLLRTKDGRVIRVLPKEQVKLLQDLRSVSQSLHDANWDKLITTWEKNERDLREKLAVASDESLSPKELLFKKRTQRSQNGTSSFGTSAMTPKGAMGALLGRVIPVLGSFATSMALQWLNPELKFYNSALDAQAVSTTTTYSPLVVIDQGTDYDQRIGNSIRVTGINSRLYATKHASATVTILRHIILVDTQTNEAAPADADVFESGLALIAARSTPSIVESPYRFAILHDETILLDTYHPQAHRQIGLDDLVHQNLHVLFSGVGSAVTDISRGSIYEIFVSNEATNTPTVYSQRRLFFEDN